MNENIIKKWRGNFVCSIEKSIDNFYNKYVECKHCNIQRSLKRYYEKRDKISIPPKKYCEKNRDLLLAKSILNQQNRKFEKNIKKTSKGT